MSNNNDNLRLNVFSAPKKSTFTKLKYIESTIMKCIFSSNQWLTQTPLIKLRTVS